MNKLPLAIFPNELFAKNQTDNAHNASRIALASSEPGKLGLS